MAVVVVHAKLRYRKKPFLLSASIAEMSHKDVSDGLNQLPLPDPAAQAHSEKLIGLISDEMQRQGGAISFARYMEMVLYAPGLGYYSAGKHKFGAAGDFITAPEISPLFSRCLARQCRQVLENIAGGEILEFGAGTGTMAAEILRALAEWDCLPSRYLILDISADLREIQYQTLQEQAPALLDRVKWLDTMPERFRGVVLANEVLDAMPVHRVVFGAGGPCELVVTHNDQGGFAWRHQALEEGPLRQQHEAIMAEAGADTFEEGYVTEINLAAGDWLRSLAAVFEQGLILLIDYGFPRREYYHHERSGGTLMCHYRHRAHDDPLILPGLQDITAHVDFTAVAETTVAAGLTVAGYTTQAHFLLGCGLPQLLEEAGDQHIPHQITMNQQVKKLTLPHEMGELFKVISLTKGLDIPLIGFSLKDMSARL